MQDFNVCARFALPLHTVEAAIKEVLASSLAPDDLKVMDEHSLLDDQVFDNYERVMVNTTYVYGRAQRVMALCGVLAPHGGLMRVNVAAHEERFDTID